MFSLTSDGARCTTTSVPHLATTDGMSGKFERFDARPGGSYRLVLTCSGDLPRRRPGRVGGPYADPEAEVSAGVPNSRPGYGTLSRNLTCRWRCFQERDLPSHPARSGSSAPVFDAVIVGCEAMSDSPQRTAWVRLVTSILR